MFVGLDRDPLDVDLLDERSCAAARALLALSLQQLALDGACRRVVAQTAQ